MARRTVSCGKPWEGTAAFSLGVAASGHFIFTAGMTARDPEGNVVGVGDMGAQVKQCFENVGDVLRAAGAGFEDLVKVTIYVTDIAAFVITRDIREIYMRARPASTAIEVSRLIHPDMMVEIEAIALLPQK